VGFLWSESEAAWALEIQQITIKQTGERNDAEKICKALES
jgi:hypothetical protein